MTQGTEAREQGLGQPSGPRSSDPTVAGPRLLQPGTTFPGPLQTSWRASASSGFDGSVGVLREKHTGRFPGRTEDGEGEHQNCVPITYTDVCTYLPARTISVQLSGRCASVPLTFGGRGEGSLAALSF